MRTKIEIKNIKKSFGANGSSLSVVDGVDFNVGDGEFVAIVGPSGCGKTTLMNMVAGFVRPDEGSIVIDGIERTKPTSRCFIATSTSSTRNAQAIGCSTAASKRRFAPPGISTTR